MTNAQRYPQPITPGASLSARRWAKDIAGLARHVGQVVRRAPALTDDQVAALRVTLDAREAAKP